MAVVINEFEAVAEPAEGRREAEGSGDGGGAREPLGPKAILPALALLAARRARLRAD